MRKLLIVFLLVGGPALFLLFAQSGGDMRPVRTVQDPYPVFADVAVDPDSNIVAFTDENKFSLRTYDRDLATNDVADPRTVIAGPATEFDFVCGVALDAINKEMYAANNDTGADVMVFKYDANGNVPPARKLSPAATGTWGVSLDIANNEVGITVQHINKVAVFRRTAEGDEKPLRIIQGPATGLADPHGIFIDAANNEIFVANHDSFHQMESGEGSRNEETAAVARGTYQAGDRPRAAIPLRPSTGKFVESSITVYGRTAQGNAAPVRVIRGNRTELGLPMKVFVDAAHNELFVASSGSNSILFFSRTANGNVAPIPKIQGPDTQLKKPVGLYVDLKNDEIWATSPEQHAAMVYSRTATGNAKPVRVLRTAPEGTPAPGLGNPGGIAYDSRREEILVPN